MKDKVLLILKGFVLGIVNIIPGVSGGTLAITLGIYERMIEAISHFFSNFKDNLKFVMFLGIGILISLDLSNFNTSKVIEMMQMFYGCSSLTSLDLSNLEINTSANVNLYQAFYGCKSLTYINLSKADFTKVTGYWNMFKSVPNNASIIVKDATAKSWITGKWGDLTNITIAS